MKSRLISTICILIILGLSTLGVESANAYQFVKTQGRTLMVDFEQDGQYVPFRIKGVGYSPTPVGRYPSDWGYADPADPRPDNLFDDPAILNRDFALIRDMKANAVRIWAGNNRQVTAQDVQDAFSPWYNQWESIGRNTSYLTTRSFDLAVQNNLKIIAGFEMPWPGQIQCVNGQTQYTMWTDYANPNVRYKLIAQFDAFVRQFMNHPGLLFWTIGNENNIAFGDNLAQRQAYYTLVNEMALRAHVLEGTNAHPVATVVSDIGDIGNALFGTQDANMQNLDIWGSNVYRGISFGDLFTVYASKSQKPLWISEYGIDAWQSTSTTNPASGAENQEQQALYAGKLYAEVEKNSTVAIGSSIMEYSDEWWKPYEWTCLQYDAQNKCIQWTFDAHNYLGLGPADYTCPADGTIDFYPACPDKYFQEEWWGLMSIAKNATPYTPDIMTPRAVYQTLQLKFQNNQTPWKDNSNGNLVINLAINRTAGYHFTPLKAGKINYLGGYFNGTKTIKLWNKKTGALLAQATVSATNSWKYAAITPVNVLAGTTYTVAVYEAGSGASQRESIVRLPQTYGDIKITASTYINGNNRPTGNVLGIMYGQVDIGFQPN